MFTYSNSNLHVNKINNKVLSSKKWPNICEHQFLHNRVENEQLFTNTGMPISVVTLICYSVQVEISNLIVDNNEHGENGSFSCCFIQINGSIYDTTLFSKVASIVLLRVPLILTNIERVYPGGWQYQQETFLSPGRVENPQGLVFRPIFQIIM